MRKFIACVLLLLLTACASAPRESADPRQVTLRGIHLRMPRAEVEAALLAEGFSKAGPTNWWRYEDTLTGGAQEFMLTGYNLLDGQEVLSIAYYTRAWHYERFRERFGTEGARRSEVQRLLGVDPIIWRPLAEPVENGNAFVFAANPRQARRLTSDRIKSCFWAWACISVSEGVDCRPVVNRPQGAVIEGEYRQLAQLTIQMYDYDLFVPDLMENTAFRERNLEGLGCPVFFID